MKPKGKFGVVLTVVAGIGMVVTIVMTAKKAPEAQKMKEAALELKRKETGDENAQLTKMEAIKVQASCYAPVIISATMTVGSLIGSQIIPQSALRDLERMHNTYREMNAKLNGKEAEKALNDIATKKVSQSTDAGKKETFVLTFRSKDIPFESTELEVLQSEYEINRYLWVADRVITFNELLDFFEIKDKVDGGDQVGWDTYLGEVYYGYSWIDFAHRKGTLNGKPVTYIDMPFPCHTLQESEIEEELTV